MGGIALFEISQFKASLQCILVNLTYINNKIDFLLILLLFLALPCDMYNLFNVRKGMAHGAHARRLTEIHSFPFNGLPLSTF